MIYNKNCINSFNYILLKMNWFLPLIILHDIFSYFFQYIFFTVFFIDKSNIKLNCIKKITRRLENTNIVYIKIFQTLCCEKDLLNENEKNFLMKYIDNVPYSDNEIDYLYLEKVCKEYSITLNSKIPCNSGIMAVVFKGKIENKNFQDIVIKLKKIGIDERYEIAYNNLLKLAYYTKFIPFLKNFQIEKLLYDCKENTLLQGDFINEVSNLNDIYFKIDNNQELRVPICFPEITSKYNNIIIMEDISGLKINDLLNMSQEIKNNFAKLLLKFGICCQLNYGILNGDFHAGNTFFYLNYDENNNPIYQIGIIDFGLSFKISKKNQERDFKFLYNMFTLHEFEYCEELIISWLESPKMWYELSPHHKNKCMKLLQQNILYCKNMDLDFFYSIAELFNKNNLHLNKEFNNLVLSLCCSRAQAAILTDELVKITKEVMNSLYNINNILKIE